MRSEIHDLRGEQRLVTHRCIVALLGVLLLTGGLVGRMFYLQVASFEHFSTLSQENRVKLVAMPPSRGLIYDRNGVLLAGNRPSFRLVVTPEQVEDMENMLARLDGIIEVSESEVARFNDLVARKRSFKEIPLKFRLDEKEVARLAVNRHRFPGVEVQAELTRHYPFEEVGVHVVGYVGRINPQDLQHMDEAGELGDYSATSHIGKIGIERYYEDLLHGTVGMERVETNALGRELRPLERTPPVPGKDIYLTLDIRLQQAAEQALEGHRGAIVAIDPDNGQVLALVSKPGYDPNSFVNGISAGDYRALQGDRDQPLFNRALRGQYPPGSTVKPFIALAALENGTVTVQDKIFCSGYYRIPGNDHRYRGWKEWGHGWQNLIEAIAQSNDIFFYNVAYRLGIDAMSRFMARFNFGRETGIDLYGEQPGINPSREWKRAVKGKPWYHGETVITGIGQGYTLATPLQLAQATALMANRGRRIQPHLLLATRAAVDSEHVPTPAAEPGAPITLQDPAHWEQVIEGMRRVVHGASGTARGISEGLEYSMAGKSGTAQVFGLAEGEEYNSEELAERLHDHALFIAFAPVEDPELAVAVVVENGGSGSGVAGPIARKVLDAYMKMTGDVRPS